MSTPLTWRQILRETLARGHQPVVVIDAVRRRLGREPDSAESNAARRAAHRLAAEGLAEVFCVRERTSGGRSRLVLTIVGTEHQMVGQRRTGTARRGRPRSEIQVARTIARAVSGAGRAAHQLDVQRISSADAAALAQQLDEPLSALLRLHQELARRTE